jgi:hypothetical protein
MIRYNYNMTLILAIFLSFPSVFAAYKDIEFINKKLEPTKDTLEWGGTCAGGRRYITEGLEYTLSTFKNDPHYTCSEAYRLGSFEAITDFIIVNDGSHKINPLGFTERKASREFNFVFEEGARQNLKMEINENANADGNSSSWNMHSVLIIIPRTILPYVEHAKEENKFIVHLPNEEVIEFDANTREIIGGVFQEGPIDTREDRFKRKFAEMKYNGAGYLIRVDQRGELPEADNVWGVKKFATISKGEKSCKVSVSKLWDQEGGEASKHYFNFPTDEEFYQFVQNECGF